jgi:poly(A) polymerase/tRNA nucleotidyltransferase (CCA-adding enzyme)
MSKKILERLKYPKATIEKVYKLVRWHMFFSDTEEISLSAVRRMIVNVGKENIWDLMNLRICDRVGTGRPKEDPYRLRKYKSMLDQVMMDPVTVGMLKVDGNTLINVLHVNPGPQIGLILNALLEEVLDDPKKNTEEFLMKRAVELNGTDLVVLKELADKGKKAREAKEQEQIKEINRKYSVK